MIPSQPFHTESRAELRVFDLLRSAFSGPDQNSWFAMHSLNLPEHEYKRFGEIDFVVCGPDGLFALEVKGGRVSCRDGQWQTQNKHGGVDPLKESPFRQAEGAMHGLLKKLPSELTRQLLVGYGVVMPDVELGVRGAEWDQAVLAGPRECRAFEKWLMGLSAHWRAKDSRKGKLSADSLRRLQQALRPDFEGVRPLHVDAHSVEQRIARLTSDQLRLIDLVEANERVICSGGAGTGKTMLALELARRWGASGMRVALTCHSPWLKAYLERSAPPSLTVGLTDSIHVTARREGIDRFDALIVDEGQDVLNIEALDNLERVLEGGFSKGRWCFFHDVNNQTGLCGEYSPDAYEYLNSFGAVRAPLSSNCRNTRQILNEIQDVLKADLGNASVGDGPIVRKIAVSNFEQASDALQKELRELVDEHGFDWTQIVVLSQLGLAQSSASALNSGPGMRIVEMDSYSPSNIGRGGISFAKIDNFKGLESEVIVLVDLPSPGKDDASRALHYVGMSRARALLSIISIDA